jgi:hypothetical protein
MDAAALARELARSTEGRDWDAASVERFGELLSEAIRAEPAQTNAALDILTARLDASRLEDADGVAHVALAAGVLVERGGEPRAIGTTLLEFMPKVLEAAAEFVRQYRVAYPEPSAPELDDSELVAYVADTPIELSRFRALLDQDAKGACALAGLREWVLPTVACVTRDRRG